MEIIHLNILPIYKQQVLFHFILIHFHVLDAPALENVIREMPKVWDIWETRENRISLTRWKKKRKTKFCRCRNRRLLFVLLNFCYLFDCNQFQTFSQSNREGVSSSLTNAKNHTFLFFLSRVSPIVANKQISNLFSHFSFSTILKSKRRNKTKQIQNILCKCDWDFDHFNQFDQNHAFSNHNPKRMTISFALRELIICEICKNEKQNEWDFISCLFSSLQKRKEKIVKFIFIFQQTSSIHSHSFNIIKIKISQNHDEKRKRNWSSTTTIEKIQYPIV